MPDKPFQSYVVCTVPRSGSTLLCKLLAGTNIAGNPESYFHEPSLDDWLVDLGLKATDFKTSHDALRAVFKAAIACGKGKTEIFGLRMQRHSFSFLMQQLNLLFPGNSSDVERIESAFGRTLFIHLTRPDRLDQAISRVRAEQTGLWHRRSDGSELERLSPPQESHYDPAAIRHHMQELTAFDQAWQSWFEQEQINPLRISYDDLSKNPQGVLAQVLSALHLDPKRAHSVEIPTAKLADATTGAWRLQFLGES